MAFWLNLFRLELNSTVFTIITKNINLLFTRFLMLHRTVWRIITYIVVVILLSRWDSTFNDYRYEYAKVFPWIQVATLIDCKYHISGTSYTTVHEDDLSNAAHSGLSELACEWATMSLDPDLLSCKVNMVSLSHL